MPCFFGGWKISLPALPFLVLFLLLSAVVVPLAAQVATPTASPRETVLIDRDWRFQKGDPTGSNESLNYFHNLLISSRLLAASSSFDPDSPPLTLPTGNPGVTFPCIQTSFDDSTWRSLNLPHDWAIEGPFNQKIVSNSCAKLPYSGVGWYRKHLSIPASDAGRQIVLAVDGAMAYSEVWLNGHFAGGWPYGYASYQVNLTPYVKPGMANVLTIRLENPDRSSRWYPGAGIYRNIWLIKTGLVHVAQWGTYLTTPQVSTDHASIDLKITLGNDSRTDEMAQTRTELFALGPNGLPTGPSLAVLTTPASSIPAHGEITVESTGALAHPQLWDTAHPHLYLAKTSVLQGSQVVDNFETNFGVRTIKFDPEQGLLLNGQRVTIKGVCLHGDLGALGIALNVRGMERQLQILREMGCNALRTSHNPVSPELLDLCDRLGILVMNESFDCWKTGKVANDYHLLFDAWGERDLRSIIRHTRNHPSIFLWSIGNEVPDQALPGGPALAKKLTGICHEEDPTRPTSAADDDPESGFNGMQNGVDVFGYNYKPGLYEKFHAAHPHIPLYGSETISALSSRGVFFQPKAIDRADYQVTSYDAPVAWPNHPESEFQQEAEHPYVAGQFVWTGLDYLGEPTPYDGETNRLPTFTRDDLRAKAKAELDATGEIIYPSRSSYFGIADLCGFPKDRFYYYQSMWRSDLPMAHLMPHWNWPGREGLKVPVTAFTSGDEAELFLNGKSLGRQKQKIDSYGIIWNDVIYQPGELSVVAYKNGREWARDSVKTTGPASQVMLKPDRADLKSDGSDLSFVTITIADAHKLPVPTAVNHLHLQVTGPADLIGVDNGDATDQQSFQIPEIDAFSGKALAILRTRPGQTGAVTLKAASDGLTPAQVTLQVH